MHIPGYRIEGELGHGGMSTVYLAEQESLGRKVALKVMAPALAADRNFGERFMHEARTVAQLAHPNILAVHDVGVTGHNYYLALEYVPGGDLKQRLLQGALTPQLALPLAEQIAAALGYAHAQGFVHRDVKPENILFREDGSAVLSDFGIAKAIGSDARMTGTGMSIGTPHYMSPEQARGQQLDGRSDLYSLGIVLYEMLTGAVPYQAEETFAVGLMHINAPVPELDDRLGKIQPLLGRLLAKDPNHRYRTANELLADIERLLAGESLQTGRSRNRKGTPTRRSGLKWALGGATLALLLVVGLTFWVENHKPKYSFGGGSLPMGGGSGRSPGVSSAQPSGPLTMASRPALLTMARQKQAANPTPWTMLQMSADPLPVRDYGILPQIVARLANFEKLELIDGFDLKPDGHFRLTLNPDARYDGQGQRRTPYFEIFGVLEPGQLSRIYGYATIRQADSPGSRHLPELDTLPKLPFDLFWDGDRVVLGNASLGQGQLDILTFRPVKLEVTNLWLSGQQKENTRIVFESQGGEISKRREHLSLQPFSLDVAFAPLAPASSLMANLRFGSLEFHDNGKLKFNIDPGSISLTAAPTYYNEQFSLNGKLSTDRFFVDERRTQVDWRNLIIDLSLGSYEPREMEDFAQQLWAIIEMESGLQAVDYKTKRLSQKQVQYGLIELLQKGLQLRVEKVATKIAGKPIQCRGSLSWDQAVGGMLGKERFSDREFFSHCRLELNFDGAKSAFKAFSFPQPIWPLLDRAIQKQVLHVNGNGTMQFSLTGEGKDFYLQGQPLRDVFN